MSEGSLFKRRFCDFWPLLERHFWLDKMGEVDSLLKSYNSLKGFITRACNEADDFVKVWKAKAIGQAQMVEGTDLLRKLKARCEKTEEVVMEIIKIDPDKEPRDFESYEEDAKKRGQKLLSLLEKKGDIGNGNSGGKRQTRRIDESLKPKALSAEATYAEFVSWKRSFLAFVKMNEMETMDLDVQQAQLRICLQSDILKWFDNQVKEDTPICGDEGCLDMIQKWFEEKYSLLWRRFDLFTSSQAVGQDWIEWANEIVALGTEAEIEKMKTDDILVMKLITGTKDCQLREKLLEQKEEVSVKKCFEVAKHYLLAKAGSEHFGSSANIKALRKSAYRSSKDQKHQQQFQMAGNCYNCDQKGHYAKWCPRPTNRSKIVAAIKREFQDLSSEEEDTCHVNTVRVAHVSVQSSQPVVSRLS